MIQYIENNYSFLKHSPSHIQQSEGFVRRRQFLFETPISKKPLPILNGNEYLCASNIIYVEAKAITVKYI